LPRLRLTFREFIAIIDGCGFELDQHGASSHRKYVGFVGGQKRVVTVAYHNINDVILHKTLASMIRQSGIRKKTFRR
jgi:predicted RNA binding protein YcfA (HicA-like mRNA interferase family)